MIHMPSVTRKRLHHCKPDADHCGFTLIELMVVIAVIAVVIGVFGTFDVETAPHAGEGASNHNSSIRFPKTVVNDGTI